MLEGGWGGEGVYVSNYEAGWLDDSPGSSIHITELTLAFKITLDQKQG